eukprot:4685977-Pleurochrysis_carterae.AAC.1
MDNLVLAVNQYIRTSDNVVGGACRLACKFGCTDVTAPGYDTYARIGVGSLCAYNPPQPLQ